MKIIHAVTGEDLSSSVYWQQVCDILWDINTTHGKGQIVSMSVFTTDPHEGFVIRQMQYGKDSRQFTVQGRDENGHMRRYVRFIGHERILR